MILDVVVNHTADVILVGSGFVGPDERPYRDCRGKAFVAVALRGRAHVPVPVRDEHAPAGDAHRRRPHREEAGVAERRHGVPRPRRHRLLVVQRNCFEQGDFFGLDDLFTEQPRVVNGLAQVYGDWIRRYGIDGFRVDTAKHVDRAFFGAWLPKIRAAARAAGVDDFEVFGEVFETDAVELSGYVRDRGLPNVIDFPLQDSLDRFAGGSAGARGVATRLSDDDYFRGPSGIAPTPRDVPRQPRHGPRGARMIANQAFGATDAELQQRRPARLQPALPPPRRARRHVRGRGRDDGERRRQGGAPGHVPDAGARLADRETGGLAGDRQGLVVRRHRQSGR